MTFADWIMRAATDDPPRGREQWAQAMSAEYASLHGGRLSWALGCWTAMLGWRLRADAVYFAALAMTVLLLYFSGFSGWRRGMIWSLLDVSPHLVLMLLAAAGLNALAPHRLLLTGVTLIAMQNLHWVVNDWYVQSRWPHTAPNGPLFIYSAPPFVAHFAEIGVCFVGALIGRWIARLWRRGGSNARPTLGIT